MSSSTGRGIPVDAEEFEDRLAAVRAELQQLAQTPFAGLDGTDAVRVAQGVEVTNRACEALINAAVAGLESGGAWAHSGARSFACWWATHTHRKTSTCRNQIKSARTLREVLPATAEALYESRISGEHVQVLSRRATKTQALRDQLNDPEMGEEFLVEQATRLPVEAFTKVVTAWAIRTDPQAADRAWREQDAAEEVFLSPTLDGYALNGWLSTEHGQALDEALQAITGVPAATDERHPSQRRADALSHLARMAVDSGRLQPDARVRPHIAITMEEPTLEALIAAGRPPMSSGAGSSEAGPSDSGTSDTAPSNTSDVTGSTGTATPSAAGPATIPGDIDHVALQRVAPAHWADGIPIPHGQTTKLLCGGEFHRIVFGPEGEILDSGRTCRLFTAAQTRAVIARDQHCQFPDCTAPPGQGEIHHSIWWYHHGRTSTDNAILLCWHHHDYVHQHHLTIAGAPRGWIFTNPDGRTIDRAPAPLSQSGPSGASTGDPLTGAAPALSSGDPPTGVAPASSPGDPPSAPPTGAAPP